MGIIISDGQKLRIVEDVLREAYENDDAYVVDMIVGMCRHKMGNNSFAKGATFKDEKEME